MTGLLGRIQKNVLKKRLAKEKAIRERAEARAELREKIVAEKKLTSAAQARGRAPPSKIGTAVKSAIKSAPSALKKAGFGLPAPGATNQLLFGAPQKQQPQFKTVKTRVPIKRKKKRKAKKFRTVTRRVRIKQKEESRPAALDFKI